MYIVIKTVKGRRYRYAQWSWREGKKVRTRSRSLGPVGAALRSIGEFIEANRTRNYGYDEDLAFQQYQQRVEQEESGRQARLADLHAKFSLTLSSERPVPIEAPVPPSASITTEAANAAPAGNADQSGAGD